MKKKRNYKKEYANYQGTEEQKKNRAKRNAARNKLKAQGRVAKGDGKHVTKLHYLGVEVIALAIYLHRKS